MGVSSRPLTLLPAPCGFRLAGVTSVEIQWTMPPSNSSGSTVYYVVKVVPLGGGASFLDIQLESGSDCITGCTALIESASLLQPATNYTLALAGVNTQAQGPFSTPIDFKTLATVPSTVSSVMAVVQKQPQHSCKLGCGRGQRHAIDQL